jgi:hypothetical protein
MDLFEKSLREMTPEELRECHRRMWDWLAKNPGHSDRQKNAYFLENKLVHHARDLAFLCYACLLAVRLAEEMISEDLRPQEDYWENTRCLYCPCRWVSVDISREEQNYCPCEKLQGSVYRVWLYAEKPETRAQFAAFVRDAWR